MAGLVEHQAAELRPPRKGFVMAIATDNTARPYDLALLDIGNDGAPPDGPADRQRFVVLWMQAETNDVYFYFNSATDAALDQTAAIAAGSTTTPSYLLTHGALLKAGGLPMGFRINRQTDRWIILRSTTAGILRLWAASADSA